MKRDFKVVIEVLNFIIRKPALAFTLDSGEIDGFDRDVVTYHVDMLIRDGIIDGRPMANRFDGLFRISGLSMRGHDFAEALNVPGVWEKLTTRLGDSMNSMTFDVMAKVASALVLEWAKGKLGMTS